MREATADRVNSFTLAPLATLQRGPTIYAAALAVLDGLHADVQTIAAWLRRSVAEVRRLLRVALAADCLDEAQRRKIADVIGPDQRRKIAGNADDKKRKIAEHPPILRKIAPPTRAGDPLRSEREKDQRDRDRTPPPIRGSRWRAVLIAAGVCVNVTRAELDTIERRTARFSIALCEQLAARYAADTAAVMGARSLVAIFLANLPAYLDHERQGAPIGTPAIERPHPGRESEYSAIVASNRRQDRQAPAPVVERVERIEAPAPVVERIEAPAPVVERVERIEARAPVAPQIDTPAAALFAHIVEESRRVLGAANFRDWPAPFTPIALTGDTVTIATADEAAAILYDKNLRGLIEAIAEHITDRPVSVVAQFRCAA